MTPSVRPAGSDGRAGDPRVLMAASQATPERPFRHDSGGSTGRFRRTRGRPARPDGGVASDALGSDREQPELDRHERRIALDAERREVRAVRLGRRWDELDPRVEAAVPEQLAAPLVDVVSGRDALVRLPAHLASRGANLVDGADELRPTLGVGDRFTEALEGRTLEVVHARAEDQLLRREP